jgi:HPt (histidine-containing phosphotransfer) domain-containing protein
MNKIDNNSAISSEKTGNSDFVFDLGEARNRCYDQEMFEQMREFFFSQSVEVLEQINEALTRGDAKEVARAAHSFKGTLVYLGSPSCLEAVRCVEDSSLSGDLRAASDFVCQLAFQTEMLMKALKESEGMKNEI